MPPLPFAETASALSYLPDAEALFFLYGTGCEACAAAEPELDRFAAKSKSGLLILRLNAAGDQARRVLSKITATPTYVFKRGGNSVAHVGALREAELAKWIARARKALTEG